MAAVLATPKTVQCRYTDKLRRCPNPAVESTGDVLLCNAHILKTIQLLEAYGFTVTAPAASHCDDCKH
jgi:hypothetical protein